jgi:hypothetical protein
MEPNSEVAIQASQVTTWERGETEEHPIQTRKITIIHSLIRIFTIILS